MEVESLSSKPRLRLPLDHFSKIKDTPQSWKVVYPPREVLFLVVCGTIASGENTSCTLKDQCFLLESVLVCACSVRQKL
jgi:hypothetical protein